MKHKTVKSIAYGFTLVFLFSLLSFGCSSPEEKLEKAKEHYAKGREAYLLFTPKGLEEAIAQQIIDKQEPLILIRTELYNNQIAVVRITDNGPGMTDEVKQRLSEPMFTTKPVGKGTGLGLSISRQIVEKNPGIP